MWLMSAEGGSLRRLTQEDTSLLPAGYNSADLAPRWSPDGRIIGYLAPSEKGPSLWLVDPNGHMERPRLSGVQSFNWYRDSRRILCTRASTDGTNSMEMCAIDLETGQETILIEGSHTELIAAPNGRAVAYNTCLSGWTAFPPGRARATNRGTGRLACSYWRMVSRLQGDCLHPNHGFGRHLRCR
ncbi:MAG: TolB family protein [Planctomycetota bacterium]